MMFTYRIYAPVIINKIVEVRINAQTQSEAEYTISEMIKKREFDADKVLSCRYDVESEIDDKSSECFVEIYEKQ